MKANWDKRFMDLARDISTWSKDKSTKVGAIIVDEDNTILSVGYNGLPRGANDNIPERAERPQKYLYTEHAERNSIYNAVRSGICLKGAKMYVMFAPCVDCARAIINSGIKTLVTYEPDFSHDRWGESFRAAFEILEECGVYIDYYSDEYDSFIEDLNCFLELEWNFNYAEQSQPAFFCTQSDWNQTLHAKINQASANIIKANFISSANKIRCNSAVFDIIKSLEYFNPSTAKLANKYSVIVDNNIESEIVVYYDGVRGIGSESKDKNFVRIKIMNLNY